MGGNHVVLVELEGYPDTILSGMLEIPRQVLYPVYLRHSLDLPSILLHIRRIYFYISPYKRIVDMLRVHTVLDLLMNSWQSLQTLFVVAVLVQIDCSIQYIRLLETFLVDQVQ